MKLDQFRQFRLLGGVHAGRGFVEQEQFGLGGQRPDDFEAALVTVGQGFCRLVPQFAELEDFQQFHDLRGDRRFAVPKARPAPERIANAMRTMHLNGGAHVVEHAQAGEQPDVLKSPGDAELGELMRFEIRGSVVREKKSRPRSADKLP